MSGFAEKALTVEIPYFYPFVIPSEARDLRRLFCHSEQSEESLPLVLSFRAKRGISAACFVIPSEARNLRRLFCHSRAKRGISAACFVIPERSEGSPPLVLSFRAKRGISLSARRRLSM
jgi:hypothetical protein